VPTDPLIPTAVEAVVFDAVGTLLVPEPGPAIVYAAVAARFGLRFEPDSIEGRFRRAFRREEESDRLAGWMTGESREVDRWRRIVQRTLPGLPDRGFEELFVHFAQPGAWRVPDDAATVLRTLASRRYRLGVASNFDSRLETVLAGHPALAPVRERVVVSSRLGLRKPHPGFFRAVAERMQSPVDRVILVGDDYVNDYVGATAAGMPAVLLDPAGRHLELAARITSLTDLLA
jgi:putative hydrolase of the HAD superfamily